jgi:hypothetical protein
MPNAQQIALNLVAQLDQGNIQSQASQMASTMARAIEDAFEGLGQRIAATIVSGVRSGLQGAIELTGQNRGSNFGPGILLDETGRPLTGSRAGAPEIAPNAFPQPQIGMMGGGAIIPPQPPLPSQGPSQNPLDRIRGGFVVPETQNLRDINPVVQEARAIVAARQAGVTTELGDLQKERLREAQEQIRENLGSLVQKAAELSQKLEGVSESNVNLTQAERDLLSQSKQMGQAAEAQQTALRTVSEAMGQRTATGLGQRISGALGAVGTGLSLLGELPGIERRSAAAGAELSNLSGRALMRGDIEGSIVQQRLGGQDAMRLQATKEEGAIIAGEIVAGLGLVLAPLTGGLTGIPALLAGGAGLAALTTGIRGAAGFDANVAQNVQGRTEAERMRQFEILQMGQMTRSFALQSFQGGQELGGRELSEFLFSGARDPELARRNLENAQREALPVLLSGGTLSPDMQRNLEDLLTQSRLAEQSSVTGPDGQRMGLLQFGQQIGLMPEQVQATMRQIGGMGRIFNGETQLQGMQQNVADILNLQAFGVQGAPQMAVGFARGAPQTREGMREGFETVKELVTEMIAAGVDKAAVNRSMLTVMQQAAQGLGALGPARLEAERSAATAAATFGVSQGGQVTEAQMEFSQRAMRGFLQAPSAGSGLMGAAGFSATHATQEMLRRSGIKTGLQEELIIQQFGGGAISPEAIQQLGRRQGVNISAERAQELARESQQNVLKAEQRMLGLVGQGAGLAAANLAGAKTDVEAFRSLDLLKTGTIAGSFIGPRPAIGTQIPGAGLPGAQETQALAGINVAQITSGVTTLGSNLELINRSLNELVTKIRGVTREFLAGASAMPSSKAGIMSPFTIQAAPSAPSLPSPGTLPISLPSGITGSNMGF